ncbi:hypothetical protein SDC9_189056 [bioreactor metagenome]|uniref:Uncharacterized protein n=1 Tax=bioreactor metagenome TaxID=1076179 RepID=A0A645HZC9_9ZZZZ
MSAGTKRQTGVEHYVDGIFIRHVAPAWADPQAFAKTHGVEVIHPLAFPVLIFQLFNFMREPDAQQRMVFQDGDDFFHVGFGVKQTDNVGVAPQACFARQWLKNRRVVRVLEGDGNGTRFHQGIAQCFRVSARRVQF